MSALLIFAAVSLGCFVGVASAFAPTQTLSRQTIFGSAPRTQSATVLLHASSSPSDVEEEARRLRELASQLRGEVSEFQQAKDEVAAAEQEAKNKATEQKQHIRLQYSAEVPILKSDGKTVMERVDFPPTIPGGECLFAHFDIVAIHT